MTNFRPGEIVDVVIKAARVLEPKPGHADAVDLAYTEVGPGIWASIHIDHPHSTNVEITRVAPAEWPPQPGDLWRDSYGKPWFAYDNSNLDEKAPGTDIRLCGHSAYGDGKTQKPDEVNQRYGPMTMEHRGQPQGVAE